MNALRKADREDIEDILIQVEKSFNIKFAQSELKHVLTFGELCDHVANKIERGNSSDCTAQQAFYKLRSVIAPLSSVSEISPQMPLSEILPRAGRGMKVKQIEASLGFKISILQPHKIVVGFLVFIFFALLVLLLFNIKIAVTGFILWIIATWGAVKTGKELDITMGELAQKATRENYLKVRRNPLTFNKGEIANILTEMFAEHLGLETAELSREARLQ